MADFSTLIASIEATIKENGVQAITGQVLQDELLLMVSAINQLKQDTLEGYAFYGEALPNGATRVVTQNTFFLAGAGSYMINGNEITITDSGISVIVYDCVNDEITTYQLFAYDANPTSGSANAVTSGGVKSALDTKADKNGASPDLFAGFAGNLVDTRSAGTPQGPYAFRQSGGDGVDYMVRIKGKTEAFNQLLEGLSSLSDHGMTAVENADGSISLSGTATGGAAELYFNGSNFATAGHNLLFLMSGFVNAKVQCYGPGYSAWLHTGFTPQATCVAVGTNTLFKIELRVENGVTVNETVRVSLIDLTLEGLGLTTAAAFQSLHPLPYYNPMSKLLNNAATGLETTGFNWWDEQWELGTYDTTTGAKTYNATVIRCKNKIPVFPNTVYYFKIPNGIRYFEYDASGGYLGVSTAMAASNTFTTGANTRFITFHVASTTVYGNVICINLSDASRNGQYEPYWERTLALPLNSIACHDENNNAVVVNGLDGVGTSYDEAVVENGMVTKIVKRFVRYTITGQENAAYQSNYGGYFAITSNDFTWEAGTNQRIGIISKKYTAYYATPLPSSCPDKAVMFNTGYYGNSKLLLIKDSAYSQDSAGAAQALIDLIGATVCVELATPLTLTVDTPFPAFVEVDALGTQERLPADTADNPQGGFESDSNYSISIANLVRKLSE